MSLRSMPYPEIRAAFAGIVRTSASCTKIVQQKGSSYLLSRSCVDLVSLCRLTSATELVC